MINAIFLDLNHNASINNVNQINHGLPAYQIGQLIFLLIIHEYPELESQLIFQSLILILYVELAIMVFYTCNLDQFLNFLFVLTRLDSAISFFRQHNDLGFYPDQNYFVA